jgi:hypothetical protein
MLAPYKQLIRIQPLEKKISKRIRQRRGGGGGEERWWWSAGAMRVEVRVRDAWGAMTIVDYRSFQGAAGDEVTGWRGRRLQRRRGLGGGRGHRVGGQVTQGG